MSIPLQHSAIIRVPNELMLEHFEDVAEFMRPFFVLYGYQDERSDSLVYTVISQELLDATAYLNCPTYLLSKVPSNVGETILYLRETNENPTG